MIYFCSNSSLLWIYLNVSIGVISRYLALYWFILVLFASINSSKFYLLCSYNTLKWEILFIYNISIISDFIFISASVVILKDFKDFLI